MEYLKKAVMDDADKEYDFISTLPADENGFTNEFFNTDKIEFIHTGLPRMINDSKGIELPQGYVPQTSFFQWENDTIIGLFRIRHYLNEFLRRGPGHIGYGIKAEFRGKGWGTRGLELAIEKAKGIIREDEIYMSVNKDNHASLRVQQKNGAYIHHFDKEKYYTRIKI